MCLPKHRKKARFKVMKPDRCNQKDMAAATAWNEDKQIARPATLVESGLLAMQRVAASASYVYDHLLVAARPILEYGSKDDVSWTAAQ